MTRSTPAVRRRCSRMVLGAVWVLVCSLAGPALAGTPEGEPQSPSTPPARPFPALFGGFVGSPNTTQRFDINLSVSGHSNDSMRGVFAPPSGGDTTAPWVAGSMFYSGLTVQPSYDRHWTTGSLLLSSGHGFYYYPGGGQLMTAAHTADVSVVSDLTKRLNVRATQYFGYSPFFGVGAFPGREGIDAVNWNPLYGVKLQRNTQMSTSGGLSLRMTRRVQLSAEYSRQQISFSEESRSFVNQAAGGRVDVRIARGVVLRTGYTARTGDFAAIAATGTRVVQNDIDVGFDITRSLSVSRRVVFGFNTGSTIYETPLHRYYRVLGNASLAAGITRTWSADVDFHHGLQWIQGFPEPVFVDTVSVGTGGYIGRRVQLMFSTGYSNGEPGLTPGLSTLDTYMVRSQMRVALARFAALGVDYFRYHYAFGPDFPMPSGMSRRFDRQTVRASIDLWVPLLR